MNATAPMTVRRRATRAALLAAAVLAVPALSACGVNFDAQTDQPYTPAEGVNYRDGEVDILNAMIVSGGDETGRLIAGLANNDPEADEALTGVRAGDAEAPLTISSPGGEAVIPAGGYLQLADEGSAVVVVSGEGVVPGYFVRLSFTFEGSDPVTLNVPVVEQAGPYADVSIPADPTASPSTSPSSGDEPAAEPSAAPSEEPPGDLDTRPEGD